MPGSSGGRAGPPAPGLSTSSTGPGAEAGQPRLYQGETSSDFGSRQEQLNTKFTINLTSKLDQDFNYVKPQDWRKSGLQNKLNVGFRLSDP